MEESVKRRERLRAMRTEATLQGASNNNDDSTSFSHSLTNPLIETSGALAGPEYATPRFDYYTDPMSAFSSNKRTSKVSHQIPHQNLPPRFSVPDTSPSGYRGQPNYAFDQRMSPTQGFQQGYSPIRSPLGRGSPLGTPLLNSPQVWDGHSGLYSNYVPSNLARGGNFGSPTSNFGHSRGQRFNNNWSPGSGIGGRPFQDSSRGRNRFIGNSTSPASVQSGMRGKVSYCACGYCLKSMIEDPWNSLVPVVWRRKAIGASSLGTSTADSLVRKSAGSKRSRVREVSDSLNPQPSLAEYLAASFHEAVNSETAGDESS